MKKRYLPLAITPLLAPLVGVGGATAHAVAAPAATATPLLTTVHSGSVLAAVGPTPSVTLAPSGAVTVGTTHVQHWTTTVTVPTAARGGEADLDGVAVTWALQRVAGGCSLHDSGNGVFVGRGIWTVGGSIDPLSDLTSEDCAGPASLKVTVRGYDDSSDFVNKTVKAHIRLRPASRLVGLDAGPEPVARGGLVTTTAVLQRASWSRGTYEPYAGRTIALQLRPTGGVFGTVRRPTSHESGRVSRSAPQLRTGCWRYVLGATNTTGGAISSVDCVRVR